MNELYENSKATASRLEAEVRVSAKKAEEIRNRLGGTVSVGPIGGLTPDHIKNHPDYKAAKTEYDNNFRKLQNHNQMHTKIFAKEMANERRNETDEQKKIRMAKEKAERGR